MRDQDPKGKKPQSSEPQVYVTFSWSICGVWRGWRSRCWRVKKQSQRLKAKQKFGQSRGRGETKTGVGPAREVRALWMLEFYLRPSCPKSYSQEVSAYRKCRCPPKPKRVAIAACLRWEAYIHLPARKTLAPLQRKIKSSKLHIVFHR